MGIYVIVRYLSGVDYLSQKYCGLWDGNKIKFNENKYIEFLDRLLLLWLAFYDYDEKENKEMWKYNPKTFIQWED